MACMSLPRCIRPSWHDAVRISTRETWLRQLTTTPSRRDSQLRPRITEPSIWKSIVPKYFREGGVSRSPNSGQPAPTGRQQQRDWNPITVYVILFLLIGSNAINQIGLKNDYNNYKRSTDAKIELLKEVIQRVHQGEDVDVAAVLGTGNEEKEKEWEQVIRDIEKDDEVPKELAKRSNKGSSNSETRPNRIAESSKTSDRSSAPTESDNGKASSISLTRFY